MICPKCGKENGNDAKFCEFCGNPFSDAFIQGEQQAGNYAQPGNYGQSVPGGNMGQPGNYGQTAQNGMMGNYGQSLPDRGMRQKKPFPIFPIVITIELVIVLFLGITVITSGKKNYSKDAVATDFFIHMANGEWDQAADDFVYGELSSDPFLTKQCFAAANQGTSFGVLTDCKAQDTSSFGDPLRTTVKGNNGNIDRTQVVIEYYEQGQETSRQYNVPVIERSANDKWGVMIEHYICTNYALYVPQGAAVTVDGINLTADYQVRNDSGSDEWQDKYVIPYLYQGNHTIEASMDGMETSTETVSVNSDDASYWLDSMSLKQETLEELTDKAYENMKQIYSNMLAGNGFDNVSDLFVSDAESRDMIRQSYEEMQKEYRGEDMNVQKLTFDEISSSINPKASYVTLQVPYRLDYEYESYWDDGMEKDSYADECSMEFYFVQENGNWVQTTLGCVDLSY